MRVGDVDVGGVEKLKSVRRRSEEKIARKDSHSGREKSERAKKALIPSPYDRMGKGSVCHANLASGVARDSLPLISRPHY